MRVKPSGKPLSGPERSELRAALLDSFGTPNRIQELLAYQLDRDINTIVALVPGIDMKSLMFKVIETAEMEYWSGDLLVMARRVSPRSPVLLRFAQRFERGPELEFVRNPESPLEAQVVAANSLLNPASWRAKMGEQEGRVCQIELAGQTGTGFLIGPCAVMTNYHVLKPLLNGQAQPADVAVRFDFRWGADGTFQPGFAHPLAADWRIDASPSSAIDEAPDQPGVWPDPGELDYAVVRLASDLGSRPIGDDRQTDPPPPNRGWIELPTEGYGFAKNTALNILQHPGGQPIKVAFDTSAILEVDEVNGTGLNGNGTRVRYRTNTDHGSSGAPCFDANWNLVALHHAGDPSYPKLKKAEYNQGVPISRIRERLGDKVPTLLAEQCG